jgi:hypothetical protein
VRLRCSAGPPVEPEAVAQAAADHGDEHVIKFTEVALESHRRGNPDAIGAARLGIRSIT